MRTVAIARRLAWLVPTLGLLACGEKKPATPAAGAESTAAAMTPPPPAPVTAQLAEKNHSGITGSVTLTQKGDSTEVAVELKGARPDLKYPSHIHAGTCANPGAVVAPLASVAVGTDKSGSSTTMVLTSVLDSARAKFGSLVEQSHFPNMRPAACAELPAK